MKKAVVVFYSFDGNTRQIAKSISKKFGADILELEEVKRRPKGAQAFMKSGFQAFFGIKTKLKNYYTEELKDYDSFFLGTPVWAGKITPAMNSFASRLDVKGKSVYVFNLQASEVTDKPSQAAKKLGDKQRSKGAAEVKAVSFKGGGINECISDESADKMVKEYM